MELTLTRGKTAVIDDDMAHLGNWKWHAFKNANGNWYAARGFRREDGAKRIMFLHQAILGFPLNGLEIDHRDGDGLNDVRDNLRHVTKRENQWNRKHRREGKTSSRYAGVSWLKSDKRWRASIQIDKREINLGNFMSEMEAANAYQEKLKEISK